MTIVSAVPLTIAIRYCGASNYFYENSAGRPPRGKIPAIFQLTFAILRSTRKVFAHGTKDHGWNRARNGPRRGRALGLHHRPGPACRRGSAAARVAGGPDQSERDSGARQGRIA